MDVHHQNTVVAVKESRVIKTSYSNSKSPNKDNTYFLTDIFVTQFFVQSGKFGFQRSYQTFSIRLKTVGDKKTHNSTTEAVVEESD